MQDSDVADFAGLAILAECLHTGTVTQSNHHVEVNREKIIRRLLDGLVQLLTRDPADNAACCIYFSANCIDEVTLVFINRRELSKILSNISDFVLKRPPTRAFLPRNIGVGSHPDELELAKLTFPYCLPRL